MGVYKYIRETWKKPKENLGSLHKDRLVEWRRQPVTVRLDKPTRLDRARSLGYKAKQGIFVVRQRVQRGGRQRPDIKGGRRPRHFGQRKDLDMSYQVVCERRASAKYPNCEVLNSYYVTKDGKHIWYEVIMVDRAHPSILADKELSGVAGQKGRSERGRTSASRRSKQKN